MCTDGHSVNPLTWNPTCATKECPSCPDLQVNIDKKLLPIEITVFQWQTKKQKIKNKQSKWVRKNVFTLYPEEVTLEMIKSVKTSLPNLCKHIYAANYQWHAHSTLRNNLDESLLKFNSLKIQHHWHIQPNLS